MRGTHAEKTELEPFRKGYQVNLRRSGIPAIWRVCPCLGWWCKAQQSQKVQEHQQVKLPEAVSEACDGMGWRRRCQTTSSLGLWLVHMCDSTSLLVEIPDPNLLKLCLRLWLTKRLLPHHPLRDFATSSNGKLMKKWVNRIGRCLRGLIIRPRAERLLRTVPDH